MKTKRMLILFGAVVLIAISSYLFFSRVHGDKVSKTSIEPITSAEHESKIEDHSKQHIPTVFIHGWKGSERSFRTMFQRFSNNYDGPQRVMVVKVAPNGAITISGKLTNEKIPLIQVLFMDNHESMEKQASWLINVFRTLKKEEGIKRVNVVSHSMGGKAFTCYLEQIDHPDKYPKVEKYVAIAAPFDWIDGPQNEADYTINELKQRSSLYQNRKRLPKDLVVLAIAGEIHNPQEGDGVVPLQSAFFGRYFFNRAHYSEKIVYGPSAQHSQLHENPQVDRLIAGFLWHIIPK
jgi:uncharacterized alpha/beta hydrolase family protein